MTINPLFKLRVGRQAKTMLVLWALTISYGCTFRVIAYRNADTFLAMKLEKTFDLDDAQMHIAESVIDKKLEWHKTSEIPLYARVLTEFKQRITNGLSEEDFNWVNEKSRDLARRIWDNIEPESVSFLAGLKPENLRQLKKTNSENNKEKEEELAKPSAVQQEKELDKLIARFRTWTGPLNQDQINRVAEFVKATDGFEAARFEQAKRNQAEFQTALETQSEAVIKATIRKLLFEREKIEGKEFQSIAALRKDEWKKLFFDFDRSLTVKQRKHLLKEIDSWLEDLHRLSE